MSPINPIFPILFVVASQSDTPIRANNKTVQKFERLPEKSAKIPYPVEKTYSRKWHSRNKTPEFTFTQEFREDYSTGPKNPEKRQAFLQKKEAIKQRQQYRKKRIQDKLSGRKMGFPIKITQNSDNQLDRILDIAEIWEDRLKI